jgi:hypothetical protein
MTRTIVPDSATAKLTPVMPRSAERSGAGGDVLVHDRRGDMAGAVVVELDDELAEVGLDDVDARLSQRRVQIELLAGHRLALDGPPAPVLPGDGHNGRGRLLGGRGQVNLDPEAIEAADQTGQVFVETIECVVLDLPGELAQRVGIA